MLLKTHENRCSKAPPKITQTPHPRTTLIEHCSLLHPKTMSNRQIIRDPSHAGSWYSSSKSQLNSQLDGWLDDVKTPLKCIGPQTEGQEVKELPVPGARIIIGP
jgi:hypothetical protein